MEGVSDSFVYDGFPGDYPLNKNIKVEGTRCFAEAIMINGQHAAIKKIKADLGKVTDGYHTFDELYEHRIVIYIALCKMINAKEYGKVEMEKRTVWRSQAHSDGSVWDGWFILGIGMKPGEQITYHLPMSKWDECSFAGTLGTAPEFDGHTSADVLKRLSQL